jgi:putative transposase
MKKGRYTEEQIAFALQQAEHGTSVAEVCWKTGVTEQSFYRWKKKFGGMLPSDMTKLKQLEDENTKLKKLVADLSLDKAMLQDVLSKKLGWPVDRRGAAIYLLQQYSVNERRMCSVLKMYRNAYRYQSVKDQQAQLRMRIREIAEVRIRYGYRRIDALLLREGWHIDHKRVYRIYREEGLNLRRKSKKRLKSVSRIPSTIAPNTLNECWAMDFVSDQFYNGKRFRTLTLLDLYSRECLALHVDKSITGEAVANVLDQVIQTKGLPQRIKVDNGPEFISKALDAWAYFNHIQLDYSRPGTPTDNAIIESFNGSFRDECLNTNWFLSLADARDKIGRWKDDYNELCPHSSLTYLTPADFAREQAEIAV